MNMLKNSLFGLFLLVGAAMQCAEQPKKIKPKEATQPVAQHNFSGNESVIFCRVAIPKTLQNLSDNLIADIQQRSALFAYNFLAASTHDDVQDNLAQLKHIFSIPADKRLSGLNMPWNLETDGSELLALHTYIHKHLRSMPNQLYAINLEIMLLQAMQFFVATFSDTADPQHETIIMKRLTVTCARRNLHLQKLKKAQDEATERTAPRPTTSA